MKIERTATGHHLRPELVIRAYVGLRQVEEETLLRGPGQTRAITDLRHELMFLLHDLTPASLATIGQIFGGRDGSTVWEAIAKVADRAGADPDYRARLREARGACIRAATANLPAGPSVGDGRSLVARVMAVTSVLRDPHLSHEDARNAALQILNATGVTHG